MSLRFIPIILFGVYLAYYWFANQENVPITGRSQLIDISREQEEALGLQSYQDILSRSAVLTDGEVVDQVRSIGRKLVDAARIEGIDPGFEWEFNVIRSDQANAFALPGGKVAVYTGLLPIAENADGLSAIMGHEIAHAIARHGAERMAYQKLIRIGSMAAALVVGDMGYSAQKAVMGAFGVGSQYGVLLPFSRKHETESDFIGLRLLARACFDPGEAPKLWQRMAEHAGRNSGSEFMSTHPSPQTRIEQFEAWLPEARELGMKNCSNTRSGRGQRTFKP
ncbi:MAG: M48 family metallopeptidase [Gammaproteobacteria bacterium]|nr:M48 family metallopeptidase [Gammaproteobacteria bacterium]